MFIPFTKPLDLPNTLESGQAFRWRRERTSDATISDHKQWFTGVIFNNIVRMCHVPYGIEFQCSPDDEAVLKPLIFDYLRLGDDLEEIYQSIAIDDWMTEATSHYHGMRLLRQDPWECLVSFLCSLTSNISRIKNNVEDLAKYFGQPIIFGDSIRHTFPTAVELAAVGEKQLRELRIGFRAKYIDIVSNMVAESSLDLMSLRSESYIDCLELLTKFPGVGDKVANCVLLFSMDKLEAFPVDVWIDRVLGEIYGDAIGSKKISQKNQMRMWAQNYFGDYAGYANQYLFHRRRLHKKTKD